MTDKHGATKSIFLLTSLHPLQGDITIHTGSADFKQICHLKGTSHNYNEKKTTIISVSVSLVQYEPAKLQIVPLNNLFDCYILYLEDIN